jgi:CBS domain-containing protein
MNRRDMHTEAMLRHLGAAYYDSLHGRASAADVARARSAVEERLGPGAPGPASASAQAPATGSAPRGNGHQHGRWHSRVRDIMTADVVTVDRLTSYKDIAGLLAEHHVSALPVLAMGRRVVGVVSEADLLSAPRDGEPRADTPITARLPRPGGRAREHPPLTAGELMSAPAVTIRPGASLAAAVRLMRTRKVGHLPVVGDDGALAGIVTRRDLLRVFLRPDEEIARQVRDLLTEILLADPAEIKVWVHDGVVTVSGRLGSERRHDDLTPVALRLIWDIDGVVDVVDRLGAVS